MSYPAVNGTEQRRAYVYLPTMYEAQPERRFPVLYMFDGQNVFFNEDATYGKSWGVADYLEYTDTPLIVAAIEAGDETAAEMAQRDHILIQGERFTDFMAQLSKGEPNRR